MESLFIEVIEKYFASKNVIVQILKKVMLEQPYWIVWRSSRKGLLWHDIMCLDFQGAFDCKVMAKVRIWGISSVTTLKHINTIEKRTYYFTLHFTLPQINKYISEDICSTISLSFCRQLISYAPLYQLSIGSRFIDLAITLYDCLFLLCWFLKMLFAFNSFL